MSSKVLLRSAAEVARPIEWRTLGGAPAVPQTKPAEQEPVAAVAAPSLQEIKALEIRIAQLTEASHAESANAYQKGFREGETQGRAQASSALQPLLNRMTKTVNELCDLRPRLRQNAEGDVVQLAVAIAKRVLHRELSIDPSAMQALVQVALGKLDRQEVYRVIVHSSQAAAIRSALGSRSNQVEVVADASREPGTLVFETNRGKLDASIQAQMEEIERGLTDRVRNA